MILSQCLRRGVGDVEDVDGTGEGFDLLRHLDIAVEDILHGCLVGCVCPLLKPYPGTNECIHRAKGQSYMMRSRRITGLST